MPRHRCVKVDVALIPKSGFRLTARSPSPSRCCRYSRDQRATTIHGPRRVVSRWRPCVEPSRVLSQPSVRLRRAPIRTSLLLRQTPPHGLAIQCDPSRQRRDRQPVHCTRPMKFFPQLASDHPRFLRPLGQARDGAPSALQYSAHDHFSFVEEGGESSVTLTGDYWVTAGSRRKNVPRGVDELA